MREKSNAGTLTHPQVVHPLADPAVLLGDFLLKVLVEAGLDGGELGQRWPVFLFNCPANTANDTNTSEVDQRTIRV